MFHLVLSCKMDVGIPIQHIPQRVLQEFAMHVDVGTEHTWESLAEFMGLDALTISVSCCLFVMLLLSLY